MRLPTIRIPVIVTAVALVLSSVAVSPAAAGGAEPEKGPYSYANINGASGYPTLSVDFNVTGEPGKRTVKQFWFVAGYVCGEPVSVGPMQVQPNHKFKGTGQGDLGSAYTLKVKVKGKFKTKTTAKVKLKAACLGGKVTVIAKRGGNQTCEPAGPGCPRLAALR